MKPDCNAKPGRCEKHPKALYWGSKPQCAECTEPPAGVKPGLLVDGEIITGHDLRIKLIQAAKTGITEQLITKLAEAGYDPAEWRVDYNAKVPPIAPKEHGTPLVGVEYPRRPATVLPPELLIPEEEYQEIQRRKAASIAEQRERERLAAEAEKAEKAAAAEARKAAAEANAPPPAYHPKNDPRMAKSMLHAKKDTDTIKG